MPFSRVTRTQHLGSSGRTVRHPTARDGSRSVPGARPSVENGSASNGSSPPFALLVYMRSPIAVLRHVGGDVLAVVVRVLVDGDGGALRSGPLNLFLVQVDAKYGVVGNEHVAVLDHRLPGHHVARPDHRCSRPTRDPRRTAGCSAPGRPPSEIASARVCQCLTPSTIRSISGPVLAAQPADMAHRSRRPKSFIALKPQSTSRAPAPRRGRGRRGGWRRASTPEQVPDRRGPALCPTGP